MKKISLMAVMFSAAILTVFFAVDGPAPDSESGRDTDTHTQSSNLTEKEKDGITYLFHPDDEQQIKEYAVEIKKEKARFDIQFGTDVKKPLTIELHEAFEPTGSSSGNATLGGYYIKNDATLHMSKQIDSWESILIHEYTHYRTHQYYEMKKLPIDQIPVWFEEGVAEHMAGPSKPVLPSQLETLTDFRKLDSTDDFQATQEKGYSPYTQSYFAVRFLVDSHGPEVITELLESPTTGAFYSNLEGVTGETLKDFQDELPAALISQQEEVSGKFELAEELIETEKYQQAEKLLIEISESSVDPLDKDSAEAGITSIYLKQKKYDELIMKLQKKLDAGESDMRSLDFLTLTELYLIDNPQKALETIRTSMEYLKPEDLFYKQIVDMTESYEQIASGQESAGYHTLIDNGLIFRDEIRQEIVDDLKSKYPNEF